MGKLSKYFSRLGRKGGSKGTPAQMAARRQTIKLATAARKLSRRKCRVCRKRRLSKRNVTGICRVCQRAGRKARKR
jgi:hypothetical protein